MIHNSSDSYGWVAIALHWLVAVTVVGLFALGLYMTDLTYYDANYKTAPAIHKSIGILLFGAMVFRLCWRWTNQRPIPVPSLKSWETALSEWVHRLLYLLIFAVMISGYLISTADGRPVEVFGWFSVPALISGLPSQEDIAGAIHYWLAVALIAWASLHALAALKHHFFDRDETLKRMLRSTSRHIKP